MVSEAQHEQSEMMDVALPAPQPQTVNDTVTLSARRRDAMIRSIVSSQALEGVEISYDDAARIVDRVESEPLVDLD